MKCTYYVEGMHCAACELLIEKRISKFKGVKKVTAKLAEGQVIIESDENLIAEELSKLVESDGYKIHSEKIDSKKIKSRDYLIGFLAATILAIIFLGIQKLGIVNFISNDGEVTLPFVFMIGVIASLSTCMAVVGGLVLSLSSKYSKEHQTKPLVLFHLSRIIGFFILGGVIGIIGSAFLLTPTTSFILNLILFVVMIILAINLLEIFPATKKFQLRIPKSIGKYVLKIEETNNIWTPILLGISTFILPCGFTQQMQFTALASGNFLNGALIMLTFALGTFPVLSMISFISARFSKSLQSGTFFKAAGFVIIFFALFNFISSLVAIGVIAPIFSI